MIGYFFFNNTLRKYVVTFGNIFNNISVRHGNNTTAKVPVQQLTKEKFVQALDDNNTDPNVKVILPMITYDLVDIKYDASRKTNTLQNRKIYKNTETGKMNSILNAIPYDLKFKLYIFTRYETEMLQIVEQILPFFQPAFNIMIKSFPEMGITQTDVPVILDSTSINNEYVGNDSDIRHLSWELEFTMRAWIYTNLDNDAPIINRVLIDFGVMGPEDNVSLEGIEWVTDPIPSTGEDDPLIIKNTFTIVDP